MARSHSIYIVTDRYGRPVAAFTVKHECLKYVGGILPLAHEVLVMRDGQSSTPVIHDASKFYYGSTTQQK